MNRGQRSDCHGGVACALRLGLADPAYQWSASPAAAVELGATVQVTVGLGLAGPPARLSRPSDRRRGRGLESPGLASPPSPSPPADLPAGRTTWPTANYRRLRVRRGATAGLSRGLETRIRCVHWQRGRRGRGLSRVTPASACVGHESAAAWQVAVVARSRLAPSRCRLQFSFVMVAKDNPVITRRRNRQVASVSLRLSLEGD